MTKKKLRKSLPPAVKNMANSEIQTEPLSSEKEYCEIGTDPIIFDESPNPINNEIGKENAATAQNNLQIVDNQTSCISEKELLQIHPIHQTAAVTDEFQSSSFKNKPLEVLNSKNDQQIVCFDQENGMIWAYWQKYFESICKESKRDNVWKIQNIQRFLKGKALTLFINNSQNIVHWEELVDLFNEEFTTPGEVGLSDFSNITFKQGDNLMEYYNKKIKVARMLGLESKLVLQGLTDGLPSNLKQFVVVHSPKTTQEWREIVHKLEKIQISETITSPKAIVPSQSNVQEFRQWRPSRYLQGYQPNPRPNTYRFPPNNALRFQNPSNYQPRIQRPVNPMTRNHVHFQENLPPSPCKMCQQNHIMNAYHWHRECPFRINNLTPPPASPINNSSSLTNTQTEVKQLNSTGEPVSKNY